MIVKEISRLRWNQGCHLMFSESQEMDSGNIVWGQKRLTLLLKGLQLTVLFDFARHRGLGSKAQGSERSFHSIAAGRLCVGTSSTEICRMCSLMRKNMYRGCGQFLQVHLTMLILRKNKRFLLAPPVKSTWICSPLCTAQGETQDSHSV